MDSDCKGGSGDKGIRVPTELAGDNQYNNFKRKYV